MSLSEVPREQAGIAVPGIPDRANGIRGNNGTKSAFADCGPASCRYPSSGAVRASSGGGGRGPASPGNREI
jgi:hypothetical protein